jgi:hypothetical protein
MMGSVPEGLTANADNVAMIKIEIVRIFFMVTIAFIIICLPKLQKVVET